MLVGLLLVIEIISYLSFLYPPISFLAGVVLVLATLIISLQDLKYGLLIIVAELIIGSQGYLFSFELGSSKISLRIALWIIVMAVWFGQEIIQIFRDKYYLKKYQIFSYRQPLLLLLGVLILGSIIGLVSHNNSLFYFLELKRWLYIFILLPLLTSFKIKEDFSILLTVIVSAVVALCLKALILIYIFSHSFLPLVYDIYAWMRQYLLGEITRWPSGFSRIFMQSQIFLLPAAVSFFLITYKKLEERKWSFSKHTVGLSVITIICLSVIIASLSRSFWIGIVIGVLVTGVTFIGIYRPTFKKIFRFKIIVLGVLILSTALLFAIVLFPLPKPSASIDASLLSDRAIKIEAGAASRWSLLPVMWTEIRKSPIVGFGFGKSLTYKTYDPRIVASTGNGEYTTYAFEWGWLDIILKFGLLGLGVYVWLLWTLWRDSVRLLKQEALEGAVVMFSLVSLVVVHFFTPYLNHPLGFGYLALIIIFLNQKKSLHQNIT